MNVSETNSMPSTAYQVKTREDVEPAHQKNETEQVKAETRDAVSAADKGPNAGRYVDIRA